MTVAPEASPRRRVAVLDGIRGIAIVLVVLSHGWTIWPSQGIQDSPALRTLFGSGNFAVSIFFVVGAFLAVSAMLRQSDERGQFRFGVFWVRRWLRISAHVYPLVIAVLALTAMDRNMNVYAFADTRASAWHIITYTWTDYVSNSALFARPDLGHLWYVCADIWGMLLLAVLVHLLGRRRAVLLAALVAITVLVMVWRHHVYVTDGEFQALVRISCRIDSMLWGAMAAVALPWARRWSRVAPRAGGLALVALVPVMFLARTNAAYFSYAGVLLDAALFVFVLSTALAEPWQGVSRVLGWRPLQALGRYSFPLYLWHYPIFWYLSRNATDWSWEARTAVGLGVSLVISVVAMWLIERPLQRWLTAPGWGVATDLGLVGGAVALGRDRLHAARTGTADADSAHARAAQVRGEHLGDLPDPDTVGHAEEASGAAPAPETRGL